MSSNLPFSNSRLLDRFYKIYLSVAAVLLLVGVPFVFHRKLAAGVAISLLSLLIGWCWHLNRQGLAKQSIVFFATGIWFIMMGLTFGGMPPPTGGAIVITLMLAIVVHMRAAAIFAVSYMLGWLVYIVLRTLQVLPEPYFPGNPITTWFVGAIAIWAGAVAGARSGQPAAPSQLSAACRDRGRNRRHSGHWPER